jgi:hypothetical protein
MHWDFALILLFLGIALPLLGRRRVRQLMQSPSTTKLDRLSLYASTLAFQWFAAGVILWRAAAHGLRATQLGLAIENPYLTVTVATVLAVFVLMNQLISLAASPLAQPKLKDCSHNSRLNYFRRTTLSASRFSPWWSPSPSARN